MRTAVMCAGCQTYPTANAWPLLLGEQTLGRRKRLEFECVAAAAVGQKHRGLFADFALEAHMRLDHELHTASTQLFRQLMPFGIGSTTPKCRPPYWSMKRKYIGVQLTPITGDLDD